MTIGAGTGTNADPRRVVQPGMWVNLGYWQGGISPSSSTASPSTLAHHLDALENAGLVSRDPWTVHDRGKVAVRLTTLGRYAAPRLAAQPPIRSPAIASP